MGVGAASVRVLGPVTAERDGALLDLGSRKQRAVLALLLAARTHVVPVDHVIEELWRGEPPPKAMATLQSYVSRLRRVLEPEHGPRAAEVLVSAVPGYALRLSTEQVDAWSFEHLVRDSESESSAAARLEILHGALAMWAGTAFAEFADEGWAVPEISRLEELRWHARELLIDAALRAKAYPRAVVEGSSLVRDAPLREEAWRLLALAQYATARQADALATLRQARHTLAEELGLDPGPALQQLEHAVLTQTVELPAATPTTIETTQRSTAGFGAVEAAPAQRLTYEQLPPAPRLVVGREAEAARLLAAAERVSELGVGVALVGGEPGAGKSVLMRGLVEELRARGWLVAVGRCPEVDGSPPAWAWAEVLRSLAGQVPVGVFADDLAPLLRDDVPPPTGDATQARFRMHQAVADWLSSPSQRPIAIVLDDVHRADAETRRLVTSVVEKVTRTRLFVVISHRIEHSDELSELLAGIARSQPERITLGGLDDVAAEQLIAQVSGAQPSSVVLDALLERTDGNPFYLNEFARLLGSVGPRELLKTVPAGVADVVRHRLARLPESAQAILRLAAAVGRTVDVEVLTAASNVTDDEVFDALEAGEISGLMTEFGPTTMRFTHVLVRDTLYADISAARLRPMHAAIAAAVETVTPADVTALAHHLALSASRATADKAVHYCVVAAEQAESRYAYDRVVELYRQALDCLDLTEGQPRQRLDVLLRLIPALILSGDTTSFIGYRHEAVALARQLGDDHMVARAISCWYVTPWWMRDYAYIEADFVGEVTASLAGADLTDAQRCQLLSAYLCEALIRDDPTLVDTLRELLSLARRTGDAETICKALFAAIAAYPFSRDNAECHAIRQELSDVAERHDLLSFQLVVAHFDVQAAVTSGDVQPARRALDESIVLANKLELRWVNVVLNEYEGCLASMTGDLERAETIYRATVDLMRQSDPDSAAADITLAEALFTLRFAQGRLGEIVDVVRVAYQATPQLFAASLACCLAAAGEEAKASEVFAAGPPTPDDTHFRVSRWVIGARAALMLGDDLGAAEMYERLLPNEHRVSGADRGYPLEPVAHTLGALALNMNNTDAARRHLERALDIATRCRNATWIDRIQADLARCGSQE